MTPAIWNFQFLSLHCSEAVDRQYNIIVRECPYPHIQTLLNHLSIKCKDHFRPKDFPYRELNRRFNTKWSQNRTMLMTHLNWWYFSSYLWEHSVTSGWNGCHLQTDISKTWPLPSSNLKKSLTNLSFWFWWQIS